MDKIIIIDKAVNALGLQSYLERQSPDLKSIRIVEKKQALDNPSLCSKVEYAFSTWNMPILTEQEIRRAFPSLKAIFYAAGQTGYFSGPFKASGISVYDAQAENSIPVAEFVVAQILLANKGYYLALDTYRRGFWRYGFRRAREISQEKMGNYGATIGIIGFGKVGALVVRMLKPFDMKILVHDPYAHRETILAAGAESRSLKEIFQVCDVVSNHLPDLKETQGILNYSLFKLMKEQATFINTGRGRQVNEAGLVRAMRECKTRSALLDVTSREPPDPFSALYRSKNVFLSPHIAGSQGREVERLYAAAYRQFVIAATRS